MVGHQKTNTMKKIVIILAFILSFVFTAEGSNMLSSIDSKSVYTIESYPLRTIILHPVNSGTQGNISAVLVFEDGNYKLNYNGRTYSFKSISGHSYDSSVNIDGQEYVFRVKPRSYE